MISSLIPGPEAQANVGTCGPQSLISGTVVSVIGGQVFSAPLLAFDGSSSLPVSQVRGLAASGQACQWYTRRYQIGRCLGTSILPTNRYNIWRLTAGPG